MTTRWDALWENQPPNGTTAAATNGHPVDPERASRYARAAIAAETDIVAGTPPGSRNDQLNISALKLGSLVAAGHTDEATVVEHLTAAALTAGLEEHETAATIRSGLSKGKQAPRVVPDLPPVPDVTVLDVPDVTPADADDFWTARPLLTDLHTWARARRVSPWAVLGVTLARVATAVSPKVTLPPIVGGHGSLNLFVGIVGDSGSGKGAATAVAAEALTLPHIVTHSVGSGEGIAHGYMRKTREGVEMHNDAVLFTVPEIDTLGALGNRQGATLLPELRRAWSGEALGFGYADPTKRLMVPEHSYRLCLVAGIQPARAGILLDDVDAGTPQRFLWLPAGDTDAPDTPPPCPEPGTWVPPKGGLWVDAAGHFSVTVCRAAYDTVDSQRLARLRLDGQALDGHALLARLKVAAALGVADGRREVDDDDWALADVVMRKSDATRAAVGRVLADAAKARNRGRALVEADRAVVVHDRLEEAAIQRVSRSVRAKVVAAKGAWVTRRDLNRALSGAAARSHLEDALGLLVRVGQVEVDEVDGGRYRAVKEGR